LVFVDVFLPANLSHRFIILYFLAHFLLVLVLVFVQELFIGSDGFRILCPFAPFS
jgi:hypothetical protein